MVMQNNVPIGRMEFVDPKSIYVINSYSGKRAYLRHSTWAKPFSIMLWLNSGNFGTFHLSESMLILNGSVYRASEIIQNDTKIGIFFWGSKVEIHFFNFHVDESVGVRHGTKFWYKSKDELDDCASFDTSMATEGWCGISILFENLQKPTLRGLKLRELR